MQNLKTLQSYTSVILRHFVNTFCSFTILILTSFPEFPFFAGARRADCPLNLYSLIWAVSATRQSGVD